MWLASAGLVIVMVLAAIVLGRVSLASAKEDRLQERSKLQRQLLEYITGSYDPADLQATATRVPFDPDDPALDRRLLATFMVSSTGDSVSSAALIRLESGATVTRRPAGQTPPTPALLGPAWEAATHGKAARTSVFQYDGEAALALVVPVGGLKQWGVLVVTQKLLHTSAQRFAADLGSLGQGPGGYSHLDAEGRAASSWDPASLGKQLVDPSTIAALPQGVTQRSTAGSGDAQVTRLLYRKGELTGDFEQPTSTLYADLEAGQKQRDRVLLGVLLLALGSVLVMSVVQFRSARRNRARLHALLAGAHDLILVIGDDGLMTFVSPNLSTLLGHRPEDWTGTRLADQLHPDDADRLARLLTDPDGVRTVRDVRLRVPDGTYRWFDIEAGDLAGERLLTGVLLTCRDTGQRKELEDRLFEQARRDPMTGLANRAMLNREIVTRLGGPPAPELALLFIDLDGFKQVNDEHGHEAGDRLLVTIAARLRRVRSDALVARYGGDEFVLMVSDSDEGRARDLAGQVLAAISRPVDVGDGIGVQVGASIGIALAVPGVRRAEVLLKAADRAMYEAKRSGGGVALAAQLWLTEPTAPGWDGDLAQTPVLGAPVAGSPAPRIRPSRTPQPGASRSRQGLVAILAVVLAILAVAGIGLRGAVQAQQTAERQRVAERLEVTGRVADYAAALADPDRLIGPVGAAPWQLDGSVVDILVLQAVLQSDLGGTGAEATLYTPDGDVLAGDPGGSTTSVAPGTAAFARALDGHAGFDPLIRRGTVAYSAYAIPISRSGRVAAVLLIGQPLALSASQHLLELVGSLGFGAGGMSSVLPDGSVTHSWNPALIGTTISTPAGLASVRSRVPAMVPSAGDTVVLAARMDIGPANEPAAELVKYIVLDQPTSAFYAGIRDTGQERNLAMLGGVLLCLLVIGLGGLQRSRQELRAHQRLNALLAQAHDIVAITTLQGRIDFISSAVQPLLGRPPGTCTAMLDLVHPEDRSRASSFLAGRSGDTLRDVRLLQADGEAAWFDIHRTDLSADRDLRGIVLTCQEMGERKDLRDQLAHLVHHDQLTGLPNRTRILAELDDCTGDSYRACTVLFIDLDRFKPVNDTYGHEAGDSLLRAIARRLADCVRDVPGAVAGRLGGDEFAVLLPGDERLGDERRTGRIRPEAVADRILRVVAEPVQLWDAEGRRVSVGATIGIARSSSLDTPTDLLRRADQAMYEAKDAGRGRYAVHAG